MFPIPETARREAAWGLDMRTKFGRGGTHVGVNSATMLKNNEALSLRKIRHINRYFARHEVDKRARGWRKGEPGYPSAGRIAWALWGGYPAWKWTKMILRRYKKT